MDNRNEYVLVKYNPDGSKIRYSFSGDVDLDEMLQNMCYFLNGCSWSYVEALRAVKHSDDESDMVYRREHRELMEKQERELTSRRRRKKK